MRLRSVIPVLLACLALLVAALIVGCGDDGDGNGNFCEDNCAAVVAAGCSNGPSDRADCLQGCSFAQSSCPSEFNGLANCAGSNASFSCNDYDSPAPPSCADQNAALQACLMQTDAYCYAACPAVVAAGCNNGPSDVYDCIEGCDYAKATCPTEFDDSAQCAGMSPTFSCSANDSPVPDGCEAEGAALEACLQ